MELEPLDNTVYLKTVIDEYHPISIPVETEPEQAIQNMIDNNYVMTSVRTSISVHPSFAITMLGNGQISVKVPLISLLNACDSTGEYEIFTSSYVHTVKLCFNGHFIDNFTITETIEGGGKKWSLPSFNSHTPIPEYDHHWEVQITMDEDHVDDNIFFNFSKYYYNKTMRRAYARAYRNNSIYMELSEPDMYLVRYSSTYMRLSKDELLTNDLFSGLFRRN